MEDKSNAAINRLMDGEMMAWLTGEGDRPDGIRQFGEDFAEKMNWFAGLAQLRQLARLDRLFKALERVEERMYSDDQMELNMEDARYNVFAAHTRLSGEIEKVAEQARKFALQNKELLKDQDQFFDSQLYLRLKSLPGELVRDYLTFFNLVDRFGHNILKDVIEKYTKQEG